MFGKFAQAHGEEMTFRLWFDEAVSAVFELHGDGVHRRNASRLGAAIATGSFGENTTRDGVGFASDGTCRRARSLTATANISCETFVNLNTGVESAVTNGTADQDSDIFADETARTGAGAVDEISFVDQ